MVTFSYLEESGSSVPSFRKRTDRSPHRDPQTDSVQRLFVLPTEHILG